MKLWNHVLLVALVVSCTSCADDTPSETAVTNAKRGSIEERLEAIEQKLALLQVEQNAGKSAHLDCTSPSSSRVQTNIGPLLIVCNDAAPHLEGFKVRLMIGNPLAVTYNGLDLDLTWRDNLFDPPEKVRRKHLSLATDFFPGSWTPLEVVLTPATAKQMQRLSLSISASRITLQDYS